MPTHDDYAADPEVPETAGDVIDKAVEHLFGGLYPDKVSENVGMLINATIAVILHTSDKGHRFIRTGRVTAESWGEKMVQLQVLLVRACTDRVLQQLDNCVRQSRDASSSQ